MVSAKWEVHTVGQRAGLAIPLRRPYTSLKWGARRCAFLMGFQVMPRLCGPPMHFAPKGWRSLPPEPLGEEGFWELVRAENSFLICWTPQEWAPGEIQPSDATLRGKHNSPARGGSGGGKSEYTSRLFVPPEERGTDLVLVGKYIFSCPNHRLTTRLAQVKFLRWPLSMGLPLLAPTQGLPPHGSGPAKQAGHRSPALWQDPNLSTQENSTTCLPKPTLWCLEAQARKESCVHWHLNWILTIISQSWPALCFSITFFFFFS